MTQKNLEFQEDWEHESQKDLVYLWEEQMQMEQDFWAEMNRKPAKIVIINNIETPQENESTETNILPF
jgi:hypothetical protein